MGEIVIVYSLEGYAVAGGRPYHETVGLGRFGRNISVAGSLGISVFPLTSACGRPLACGAHGDLPVDVTDLALLRDRSKNVQLRLTLSVDDDADLPVILACTCFERDGILLGGQTLTDYIDATAEIPGGVSPSVTRLGLDVHSVVTLDGVPPGWTDEDIMRVVYRESTRQPVANAPIQRPVELNRFVGQIAVHGRGVTVFAGQDHHTVSACSLILHHVLFVMHNLRVLAGRSRALLGQASHAAQLAHSEQDDTVNIGIRELGRLAREAQELEVSLGFEVEAPLSSDVIPEIVLDSYRDSLAQTVGLSRSIETVSGTLSRVQSFLRSGFEQLASEQQAQRMERDAHRVRLAALVSALAIPTSLLMAFFGINSRDVDTDLSIFTPHYWGAWILYITTVAVGLFGVTRLTTGRDERKPSNMATLLSAHRGGPEDMLAPNSLEAIESALEVGVDLVEFDVRITLDGMFVTAHDAVLKTPRGDTPIERLTAQEVFRGDVGAASLEEVLKLVRGRAKAHVDLKDVGREVEIADICEQFLGPQGFVLTTLEDVSVTAIRQARPHLQVALSLGRDCAGMTRRQKFHVRRSELFPSRRVRACNPTMLAVNHQLARKGVLRWASRRSIPVLVWTVNTPDLMNWAWRDGRIWAFTTDYPRMALAVRPQTGTRHITSVRGGPGSDTAATESRTHLHT